MKKLLVTAVLLSVFCAPVFAATTPEVLEEKTVTKPAKPHEAAPAAATPAHTPTPHTGVKTTPVVKGSAETKLPAEVKVIPQASTTTGQAAPAEIPAPEPAPVPVSPTTAAKPAETKPAEEGGFFSKLFGGSKEDKQAKPQAATAVPSPVVAPTSDPAEPKVAPPKPPQIERPAPPPVDPEQVLRGKVWTSESACKKEALKGQCSSIDCATHSGGACSGYTTMIWIYR